MIGNNLVGRTVLALVMLWTGVATAQEMPDEYKAVLTSLGKTGDFKEGVLKVIVPRNDVRVAIGQRPAPTPFGFGGWVALTKGTGDMEVLMGDLVLTEDEVNPVMSALLDNGLNVTALHNHFFWEQPRMFYMHVHGMGSASDLARQLKPTIDLIDRAAKRSPQTSTPSTSTPASALDTAALATILAHHGEQNGGVYKITIGRPDIDLREHGAAINAAAHNRGVSLKLLHVAGRFAELLALTRLDSVFERIGHESDVLATLTESPRASPNDDAP